VSACLSTTPADVDALVDAVAVIAGGQQPPVALVQDPHTGDYWPEPEVRGWTQRDRRLGTHCAKGWAMSRITRLAQCRANPTSSQIRRKR
jgi:hypothetical protein